MLGVAGWLHRNSRCLTIDCDGKRLNGGCCCKPKQETSNRCNCGHLLIIISKSRADSTDRLNERSPDSAVHDGIWLESNFGPFTEHLRSWGNSLATITWYKSCIDFSHTGYGSEYNRQIILFRICACHLFFFRPTQFFANRKVWSSRLGTNFYASSVFRKGRDTYCARHWDTPVMGNIGDAHCHTVLDFHTWS